MIRSSQKMEKLDASMEKSVGFVKVN